MSRSTDLGALTAVTVEPMRPRHLHQVLAIEQVAYPNPWTGKLFAGELRAVGRTYLVAVGRVGDGHADMRVVGYAGLIVQVGEAHVTTVAVDPVHRRGKVATRLLVALLTRARAQGAEAATLEVRLTNRSAQRMYAQFGFVPAGVRPRYYRDTGEDALIMWAHDLQSPDYASRLRRQRDRLDEPGGATGDPGLPVPWVQGRLGMGQAG